MKHTSSKLIEYPWNHALLTLGFSASVVLCYVTLPSVGRGLLLKVFITLAWVGWVLYGIAIAFMVKQHRRDMAILAAQKRFIEIFEEGNPFSLHHPRNPQETKDIRLLIQATHNKRTRRLLARRMIEWLETIQTVNPL